MSRFIVTAQKPAASSACDGYRPESKDKWTHARACVFGQDQRRCADRGVLSRAATLTTSPSHVDMRGELTRCSLKHTHFYSTKLMMMLASRYNAITDACRLHQVILTFFALCSNSVTDFSAKLWLTRRRCG
ncbi:hypothetical protein TcWFU_000082 [Taenia crassiceps]|uniref:Uncharacterized protein n=1 Tax=Taenia crassiceps TaxID=6207 RepID=A0ABR4QJ21_9CEST